MLSPLLTYQELTDYLRGVTSSLFEDDLPRLISTLQYYQDRLADLTPIIESLEGGPPRRTFRKPASWMMAPKVKKSKLALDELRRREGVSYAAIAALHTLLSPIRRLPSELLTEIFIHCLPRTRFIPPGDPGSPLHLMKVCAEWYRICITSPRLWSSIVLLYPAQDLTISTMSEHSTRKAALFDMWLSRSGDLSLSLSIQSHLLTVGKVQSLLATCARRLQHVKLLFPEKDSSMLPDCEYPRLTSLEIQSPHGLQHMSINKLSDIAKHAPALQRFTWNSATGCAVRPLPVTLYWRTLTHLTLRATISINHCLHILSQVTNAVQLEFGTVLAQPDEPRSLNITLPQLSSLYINSVHSISEVFDTLTLPHLTNLSISTFLWPHASVVGLFRRSRFPLQNLIIFHASVMEAELIECLDLVQSTLKELTVQGSESSTVTDTLLERLTPKHGDDVFCARLECLAFYDCISCSPGGLARMAQSRLGGVACATDEKEYKKGEEPLRVSPLRTVELYASDPELVSLKPLRSKGMKLIAYSEKDLTVVDLELEVGT